MLTLVRRSPVFYGWVILGVACLAAFLAGGVNNVSLSVVVRPLSEERGWSRSVIAGAVAAGTIAGGLLSPLTGRWADRLSSRLLLSLGAAILGGSCVALAFATEPWHFYLWYVPARTVAHTLLVIIPLALAARWFVRWRPLALGAVSMASPLGSAVLAPIYQLTIDRAGWPAVFALLGTLALVVLLPAAATLVHARPSGLGLAPDGRPGTAEAVRQNRAARADWGAGRALRTPTVWLLVAAMLCSSAATGSIALNLAAALTEQGVPGAFAAGAVSAFALAGAAASLLWGVLAQRIPLRVLLVMAQVVSATAVVLLPGATTALLGVGLAVLAGAAARGQQALAAIVLAEYYGGNAFGTLAGVVIAAQTVALGLGPLVVAAIYDLTGSYQQGFYLLGGMYLLAGALSVFVRRPRHAEAEPAAVA